MYGLSVAALSVLLAADSSAADLRQEAWESSYNLDYDRSLAIYEQLSAANPSDPELHNYVAYTLLYRELLRNGALESQMVTLSNSFVRRLKMEPPAEVEKRFFAEIAR